MKHCPRCREGRLQDQLIETWEKRASEWILIRNVPSEVCEECGFEAVSQVTAEALQEFVEDDGTARPIETVSAKVYDFARPAGAPAEVTSTGSRVPPLRNRRGAGGEVGASPAL